MTKDPEYMEIKLISEDAELLELCREILAEITTSSWTLTAVSPLDGGFHADLCIWDYQSNTSIPDQIIWPSAKHLFLVRREDMAGFRAKTGIKEANILLKPFTRVTLAVFLGMAISAPTAASLRADCDTLLQCLIQTNLRLQEYDQDRTNFLARAVHDFRAPLTALSGYCGLLLSEPLGPLTDSQKEVLSRMQRSTGRLSRLASAMFQLSVGRQVKRQLGLQRGDIRACLDQALHEIGPLADEKRISVTAQLEPCDEQVYIDEGQIEQVLINILDNACKFTPRAGSIEIRGYPFSWDHNADHLGGLTRERRSTSPDEPNSYRVDIRDSGAPISPEHLECIFEEYTSYAGRDRSGGGLGLAICRSIINQHEGRVWAENTEAGPRFSFVLPLRHSAPHINGSTEKQVVTYTEA